MSKALKFNHYFICATCAQEKGGVLKNADGITVSLDTCKYCDGKNQLPNEGVIPRVDFTWNNKDSGYWD
jgi:hypothetical protein